MPCYVHVLSKGSKAHRFTPLLTAAFFCRACGAYPDHRQRGASWLWPTADGSEYLFYHFYDFDLANYVFLRQTDIGCEHRLPWSVAMIWHQGKDKPEQANFDKVPFGAKKLRLWNLTDRLGPHSLLSTWSLGRSTMTRILKLGQQSVGGCIAGHIPLCRNLGTVD